MTAAAVVVADHQPVSRLRINRIGLWLFLGSEAFIFTGLLAVRFDLLGTRVHPDVSQVIGLIITSILLFSSYTALRAEHAAKTGDHAGMIRYLTFTLGLGLVFLGGVALEWREAFDAFPPRTDFGTVFFTMTGIHAFHVISGLVIMSLVLFNAKRGNYAHDSWPVEAGVKYWHFVDVVWVFFYPALYLL